MSQKTPLQQLLDNLFQHAKNLDYNINEWYSPIVGARVETEIDVGILLQ